MKNKMDPLIDNCSWGLIELPEVKKALYNKWVYRVKNKQDDSKRYTARLVGKDMSTKDVTHDKLGLCANLSWFSDLKTKCLSCRDGRLEMEDMRVYTCG